MRAMVVSNTLATLVTDRLIIRLGRRTVVLGGYPGVAAASVAVALAPGAYTAFVFLAGLGFCIVTSNIAANPYYQTVLPDRVRGRVNGASKMIGWGITPVGALLGGRSDASTSRCRSWSVG